MSRPSRPWLLPVVCAVLSVAWVLWLARGAGLADEQPPVPAQASSSPATASRPADTNAPNARPDARPAPIPPSAARGADVARSATPAPVQLGFHSPAAASIGDAFDIRVSIDASQPIARVGVEVLYDPTLLKARALEEIDYAQRALGERMFRIDEINEGRAMLALVMKRGEVAPNNVPVLQFEALAPGWTQIRIVNIGVFDASGRPLTWTASGQESQISIN